MMAKRQIKRQYSDEEKAQALAVLDANGGNLSATSRLTGVPRTTLIDWSQHRGVSAAVEPLRQEKKADLAAKLEQIAHRLVDAMSDKIDSANLVQTATSLGIAIEKMQLLQGEPTDRTEHVGDVTVNDAREQLARKLDSVAARIGAPRDSGLLN